MNACNKKNSEFFLPQIFPTYISVKISVHKPKTQITELLEDGTIKMEVRAIPEKGKANIEIIKFFRKEFKISVTIKSGETQSKKLLLLEE